MTTTHTETQGPQNEPTIPDPSGATKVARGGKKTERRQGVLMRLAALVALIVVWYILTTVVGKAVVPPPSEVVGKLGQIIAHENFLSNVGHTLGRVLIGMVISLLLSIIVGIPMGLSRRVSQFMDGFVLLGRAIPGLAWALLAVMIVGINDGAPILAIILSTVPMITVQIWQGTKELDRDVMEMATVFKANRWLRLRHIILPELLPYILSGSRLGLSLSWQVVVLSELFGLSNGVGYKINLNFQDFSIAGVMAWTLSFTAIMAVLEFGIISRVESRLTRWRIPQTGA